MTPPPIAHPNGDLEFTSQAHADAWWAEHGYTTRRATWNGKQIVQERKQDPVNGYESVGYFEPVKVSNE